MSVKFMDFLDIIHIVCQEMYRDKVANFQS